MFIIFSDRAILTCEVMGFENNDTRLTDDIRLALSISSSFENSDGITLS